MKMNVPTEKLKSGFELPVLALGTWQMGGREERIENYDEERDIETIRMAVDLGMTRFDTAEMYAAGYSEEILGKALSEYNRSKLMVTSKVSPTNLRYDDVIKACEGSLKRLGMDYLDIYLIHKPNPEIPIKETMAALDKLVDDGLVKNIGVSNFTVDRFKEAQSYSDNKIILNQVHYNLIFREPVNKGVLDFCRENDVLLEAWRPLQKGMLTRSGIDVFDKICEKYNKTHAQVALNWLLSQDNVITLFKTSNPDHLKENLGSLGWNIKEKDVDFLSKNFPIQLNRSNDVPLR